MTQWTIKPQLAIVVIRTDQQGLHVKLNIFITPCAVQLHIKHQSNIIRVEVLGLEFYI